jgi:AraC-like DNA-binding protein
MRSHIKRHGVVHHIFKGIHDALKASPHFETRLIQLKPGKLINQCELLHTDAIAIYRFRYDLPCLLLGQLTTENFVTLGIAEGMTPAFFNGKKVDQRHFFLSYPGELKDVILPAFGTIYIFVLPKNFLEEHADHLKPLEGDNHEIIHLEKSEELKNQLHALFETAHESGVTESVATYMEGISVRLKSELENRKRVVYRANSRGNIFSKAVKFIFQSQTYSRSCGYVATGIHASIRSLEKVFNQYLSMSPCQFINIVQLNHFHEQILLCKASRNRPQSILAAHLGIEDYSAFTKRYKKFYGMSPMQTRKQCIQNK